MYRLLLGQIRTAAQNPHAQRTHIHRTEIVITMSRSQQAGMTKTDMQILILSIIMLKKCKLVIRLYDERDGFKFPIVNFLFLGSSFPSEPAYEVYVSQLVHYTRASV